MKKLFTLTLLSLMLVGFAASAQQGGKIRITDIKEVAPGGTFVSGANTQWTFELQNQGTVDATSTDTLAIVIGQVQNSQFTILGTMHAWIPSASDPFEVGETMDVTFDYALTANQSGTYQLGFYAYWAKNDSFFITVASYNITVSSGMEDDKLSLENAYYSNGSLFVDLGSKSNRTAELFVTTLNGQMVKHETFNVLSDTKHQVDVADLPKGIYIVGIKSEGEVLTRKIMIQ